MNIVAGIRGLLRALVGADQVDASTLVERRVTCNDCEHRRGATCGACGCFIAAKTSLAGERCPKGKW